MSCLSLFSLAPSFFLVCLLGCSSGTSMFPRENSYSLTTLYLVGTSKKRNWARRGLNVFRLLSLPLSSSLYTYLLICLSPNPILNLLVVVDIVPLYPRALVPPLLLRLRAWYIAQYADRFFSETASPAWFRFYLWMEVGYHLPLSAWAVRGLWVGG